MTVADRIRYLRERLGWTQEELASKLGYSSKSAISKIEASGNNITLKKISRLAHVLNTSEAYLMGWVSDPRPEYAESAEGIVEQASIQINKEKTNFHNLLEDTLGQSVIDSNPLFADTHKQTSTSGKVYYFDDEAAELAQELFVNEGQRILMSASRGLKPEAVKALAEIAKQMKLSNPEG